MEEKTTAILETPLAGEHRAAQARLKEYLGCVLPAAFSDFESEYRVAREAVALFDTSWHAVFSLTGRDRAKYLHAITSNNIQALEKGRGTLALLLNPQGRILAELEVYAQAEKLLVRAHASVRERTLATLNKYIISSDVKIEDLTEKMGSMAIEGPRAAAFVEQACGVALEHLPEMAIRNVTIGHISCQLLRRSHFGGAGAEFIAPRDWLPLLWENLLAACARTAADPSA